MLFQWIGFVAVLFIGFALFIGGVLNLLGSGDRTGSEYKVSNIIQSLVGIVIFVCAIYFKYIN
jgi:small-conductance mechanosensitive channel